MRNTDKMVFVFGSNEGGIHGAGAAKFAHEHRGAQYGKGFGHVGQSFAIPTKGIITHPTRRGIVGGTLSLSMINVYVQAFILYAMARPDLDFQVTRIGCGLAGLKDSDIAPMFVECSKRLHGNIYFDNMWMHEFAATGEMSPAGYSIWGTF